MSHSQNGSGFVCGLSTRKMRMPGLAPVQRHVAERLPEAFAVGRVPVDVVDVLVALGWVFGVLERAVGAALEPLRMLDEPGVVGRHLHREVECKLEPVVGRNRDETLEIGKGAELGMDRVVPTFRRADRPRASRLARPGARGVVRTLPVRAPDRMDRWQIDDIEAELRKLGNELRNAGEPAPGAREELVPGAFARSGPLDVDRVLGARHPTVALPVGKGERLRAPVGERSLPEEQSALGELAAQVLLACVDLPVVLGEPPRVSVDPGDDRECEAPDGVGDERAGEPVVAHGNERDLVRRAVRGRVAGGSPEHLMPVTNDERGDLDGVSDASLRGVATAVDGGPNVEDGDACGRHRPAHGKQKPAMTRSFGVQLHPTSLPGGQLGAPAYAFVDWLAGAGARWWQILPLGPPDDFGSPYASISAFAGRAELLAEPHAPVSPDEAERFRAANAYWIDDWVAFAGGDALADQVRFAREWGALRSYAATRGVGIIGDVPIYVAAGGCDHAAHPGLFLPLDTFVAGAPPDDLNDDGQLWGNPLYDWPAHAREGYHWWIERVRRTLSLCDMFRIDHFRGFVSYWAIPAAATTARDGHWEVGPGAALFETLEQALGKLPVIAEDLGVITPDVVELRDRMRFPGMAVMVWSELGPDDNPHRLENHRENQVVYTSTHDTQTLAGAFPGADSWELIEQAFSSRASLAIVQTQDVLGLGDDARMNRPGEVGGNWEWRLEQGQLGSADAERLRAVAERTHRA